MTTAHILLFFVGSVALSYVAIPLFLRGLKVQASEVYSQLGEPSFSNIFSRALGKQKLQFKFLCFVLSGRALTVTQGKLRVWALVVWLSYFGTLLGLVGLLYLAINNSKL